MIHQNRKMQSLVGSYITSCNLLIFVYVIGPLFSLLSEMNHGFQVIVGSFLPNSLKQHQRRMNLQQLPSPALAQAPPTAMAPPPVLTAAMPISQAAPGNGFHAPPPPPSAAPHQAHASAGHGTTSMNLNTSGFAMIGWPPSSQSMAQQHRSSPDINVSLTPQE
jgi:hypothetical protein